MENRVDCIEIDYVAYEDKVVKQLNALYSDLRKRQQNLANINNVCENVRIELEQIETKQLSKDEFKNFVQLYFKICKAVLSQET